MNLGVGVESKIDDGLDRSMKRFLDSECHLWFDVQHWGQSLDTTAIQLLSGPKGDVTRPR